MQLFNVGWYLLQFERSQNYTLNEKSTSNMHCLNIKHNQICFFFFWEDEDVYRTSCDFDKKFETECKVPLVFHYLVKSVKYALLYWGAERCTAWYLTLCMTYLDEIFSDHMVSRPMFLYKQNMYKNNYYCQQWLLVVTYFNIIIL
jgi:hypothetical protein